MSVMTQEQMLRKFRYASNTTKTAKENKYTPKEVLCCICNKPLTEERDANNMEYSDGKFFHRTCFNH